MQAAISMVLVLFTFIGQHARLGSAYSRMLTQHRIVRVRLDPLRMSSSISEMSSQFKKMRSSMAMDEKTQLMLDALRGKNLNDDDQQGRGIDMKIVEMASSNDASDVLPTVYDPVKLQRYFSKRPNAVATRVWQVVSTSAGYLAGLAGDYLTGNTKDIEVRRAAELRNTIVSLGPFFIKLGQALSIRPDVLSPRAMVELQQLCDKVPCFDNALAMKTIEEELKQPVSKIFYDMSPDPVAAASLGQVYRAKLVATNEEVAVKVQRPFVLETVSLDLHLVRQIGIFLRRFPSISSRLDIVSLLDEFANNFYQELDYNLECQNGLKIMEDMKKLPRVLIPKPYPNYTSRRVHTAQWISGEKLSQSKANDVNSLVNLGVITYLTQLLDTGFFHADPHPGNMLRTPDGRLVILDFGLMTKITDDQKFGMIEAIAHLIHRDYDQIGNDFVNLDFIPRGTDTRPIIPALTRVFEAALAGGGAKSINFQELAADLAEITFKYPFRIPPYFALIIRAISVLEGIALVGNPEFAIVDEAYPFISKRLLTDRSPRAREAFRYMIYGQSDTLDVERMIDMLQAFEKFVKVKDTGDGTSFKVQGVRGGVYVGKAGDSVGTKTLLDNSDFRNTVESYRSNLDQSVVGNSAAFATPFASTASSVPVDQNVPYRTSTVDVIDATPFPSTTTSQSAFGSSGKKENSSVREALRFFFSEDGDVLREFMIEEVSSGIDALSRDAVRDLLRRFAPPILFQRSLFVQTLTPELSAKERKMVDGLVKLVTFFLGGDMSSPSASSGEFNSRKALNTLLLGAQDPVARDRLINEVVPTLQEFAPKMREFGGQLTRKLILKASARALTASLDAIFGPENEDISNKKSTTTANAAKSVNSNVEV